MSDRWYAPIIDHRGFEQYLQPVSISKRGCLTSVSESIRSPCEALRAELGVTPRPLPMTGLPAQRPLIMRLGTISTLMTTLGTAQPVLLMVLLYSLSTSGLFLNYLHGIMEFEMR